MSVDILRLLVNFNRIHYTVNNNSEFICNLLEIKKSKTIFVCR